LGTADGEEGMTVGWTLGNWACVVLNIEETICKFEAFKGHIEVVGSGWSSKELYYRASMPNKRLDVLSRMKDT
jgi:hypothetical protein